MLTEPPGSFNLRDQKKIINKMRTTLFSHKKKQECLGQKHEVNLKFKLEVEPNMLTEPPGSFNLRDQNFYKQACCAGCLRRPFPMKLHQQAKFAPSVKWP